MNERVQISVPQLVHLNRQGATLPIYTGRIRTRHIGNYQSPFRGRGMEFEESRLYQPGDDVRNIDWRVTARTNRTHTKLFREERERPVLLWVDFRASMFFATRGRYKSVAAAQLASLLGWSATYQGDRIGGLVFSEAMHHELKPQRGRSSVLRLIRQMVTHPAWAAAEARSTDLAAAHRALLRLRAVARPGNLLFLLSDFRYWDAGTEAHLIELKRHCDLALIFIYDPIEQELPPAGRYPISDGTRRQVLDSFDRQWVEDYRRRFAQRCARMETLARQQGIRLIRCRTSDDPYQALLDGLVSGSSRR